MTQINVLLTGLALCCLSALVAGLEAAEATKGPANAPRVNVLYINADDLGVMDLGYISDRYRTPHIDRLRSEGMLFSEAYAPAANCAPSRACVFSGQLGPRHGVYTVGSSERGKARDRKIVPVENVPFLPAGNLTLAEVFQEAGYRTIHLGKWHVSKDPLERGFDINVGGDGGGSPTGGYFVPFGKGSMESFNESYPVGTHRVDIYADKAVEFLRESQEQPFFMHMAFYSVHTRLEPVPEYVEGYDASEVDPVYASMIEKMDEGIGRILAELDALSLRERTLIVFSSDNGALRHISSQDPYRAGKGSYFEGGIRIPLLVSWKGRIEEGARCEVPVSGIDFYPTFLEAAGLPVPKGKRLDGTSLLPLLKQEGGFPERALFWHFPIYLQAYRGEADGAHDPLFRTRPGSVVLSGKWKLHEYFEDGRVELYNLERDLGEREDVSSAYPEKADELRRLLVEWRREMNAEVPHLANPDYRER
ncbi:sulfatase [Pelagicoccus sp. SDUM812005]|uniref:sulfatase n=1 Tax=Pelagicoccus sp. SDUM812005 TaxID=3041257 RepID=UPI00280C4CA8|nr:sulfatase [Pelagicoccus sp. SDUM812005]MDQ8181615.1 sulfatase [Pelagicoccus sp. SDUM812005]